MILRRVIKHVRNQEWTAIVIDFFIVVFGVFVGLQVTNWSASRADMALEQEYMERVLVDVEKSINFTNGTRGYMMDHNIKAKLILDSLLACQLPLDKRDDFADGLTRLGKVVPSTFILGTLDEMQFAGKYSILRNTDLRDSLNTLKIEAQKEQDLILSITARVGPSMAYIDAWVVIISDDALHSAHIWGGMI